MAEMRRKWLDAAERFADLGSKFQQRYEGRTGDDVDDRLHTAIADAMHAVEEVLIAAGRALDDDTPLREDAQRALGALREALAVTFTDATAEIEAASQRLRLGLAELSGYEDVLDRT